MPHIRIYMVMIKKYKLSENWKRHVIVSTRLYTSTLSLTYRMEIALKQRFTFLKYSPFQFGSSLLPILEGSFPCLMNSLIMT